MSIDLEETRSDLERRKIAPATIASLLDRLRDEHGLFIACPNCGRRRNFSHVIDAVTDWEELIPLLERAWCQRCVREDILANLVCVLTRHPGDPQEQEQVTHYGFRAAGKRRRRF
jgi:hypothetical protein